jgi:enoyl-CoA hydratase/carnithine racemase
MEGRCVTLTIQRPERRNALTGDMYRALVFEKEGTKTR